MLGADRWGDFDDDDKELKRREVIVIVMWPDKEIKITSLTRIELDDFFCLVNFTIATIPLLLVKLYYDTSTHN